MGLQFAAPFPDLGEFFLVGIMWVNWEELHLVGVGSGDIS